MFGTIFARKTWGGSFTIFKKYPYVLPNPPQSPLFVPFEAKMRIIPYRRKIMKDKRPQTIDSELNMRATAGVNAQVIQDLLLPDLPMSGVLGSINESKDQQNSGD